MTGYPVNLLGRHGRNICLCIERTPKAQRTTQVTLALGVNGFIRGSLTEWLQHQQSHQLPKLWVSHCHLTPSGTHGLSSCPAMEVVDDLTKLQSRAQPQLSCPAGAATRPGHFGEGSEHSSHCTKLGSSDSREVEKQALCQVVWKVRSGGPWSMKPREGVPLPDETPCSCGLGA